MSHWRDKVVLITGGSQGLGFHLARAWGRGGARVIIVARNQERLEAAATKLRGEKIRVTPYAADVTNPDQIADLAAWQAREFDRIDTLVNAAGRSARGTAIETSLDDYRSMLELNFLAAVSCSQSFLEGLNKSQGNIVNIGSLASKVAAPYMGSYAPSKFALAAFSQQLRLENDAVHVLLVCPGPIQRDEVDRYADQSQSIPPEARKPGGGAKVKLLDPAKLADQIVLAAERRKLVLLSPGKSRILFIAQELSARFGDWLLRKLMSRAKRS